MEAVLRPGVIAITLALAACGQAPGPATEAPLAARSAQAAAPTGLHGEVIASRIAALPAPYNLGDYARGERVFAQCRACHTIGAGEPNRVGPRLHGVIDRAAGAVTDFRYSAALKESGVVWDAATLDRWVADPRVVIATNNMIFPGLRKEEDRRDLIAYVAVASAD